MSGYISVPGSFIKIPVIMNSKAGSTGSNLLILNMAASTDPTWISAFYASYTGRPSQKRNF